MAWNEGRGEGNGIEQKHGGEDIDRKQETDRNRFRSRQIGRHTMIKIETMREAATEEIERDKPMDKSRALSEWYSTNLDTKHFSPFFCENDKSCVIYFLFLTIL